MKKKLAIDENIIRDRISEDLSVIENRLVLIEKEFRLDNNYGANGRIDLLAKDEYDNFVVIELKRSDQAARQATHELFKYLSILSRQLGVNNSKLRAILVSTTWHELNLPFAEYVEITPFHTKGVKISVDEEGYVISTESVSQIQLNKPLEFSSVQMVYLYEDEPTRDKATKYISKALKSVSVEDHFLIGCDYIGDNHHVMYPFGTYIVFSSPLLMLDDEQAERLKNKINWDNELDQLDENFLVAMPRNKIPRGSAEVGYPEKLRSISENWRLNVKLRHGRFKSNERILSDEDLLSGAMLNEGGATYYLSKLSSPQFPDQWAKLLEDISYVVLGNEHWTCTIPKILEYISLIDHNSKISIHIYNMADTAFMLGKLSARDFRYLPSIQIMSKEKSGVRYIVSTAAWNGSIIKISPYDFIRKAYESIDNWMLKRHFGEQFDCDDYARKLANIETPIIEIWAPDNGSAGHSLLSVENDQLNRTPFKTTTLNDMAKFVDDNQSFFNEYYKLMNSVSSGLV